MWNADIEPLPAGRGQRIRVLHGSESVRYAGVLECWMHDADFRAFFIRLLADAPFPACFWETPPVTRGSIEQPFEFVLVDSPVLAGVMADAGAFAGHFAAAGADEPVVSFPNLGHDALLVAPRPEAPQDAYPHLAAFSRRAPAFQQHALWKTVARVAAGRLSRRPLWISTSGLGVYWLHVRLDSTPKYYTFRPYTICGGKGDHVYPDIHDGV